jgi:hypothetical protein
MVVVKLLVKHIRLISFPNSLFIEEHCKVHIDVNYVNYAYHVHMEDNTKEESIKA